MELTPDQIQEFSDRYLCTARTDESAALLDLIASDPAWMATGAGFGDNAGHDEPLCPRCGDVYGASNIELWEHATNGKSIMITTYWCNADDMWTESVGPRVIQWVSTSA